jgi:hypothetical protein
MEHTSKGLGESMKILFSGEWHYPSGGSRDFVMLGTEQECLDKYQHMAMNTLGGVDVWPRQCCDWGEIVDHTTMKQEIFLSFRRHNFSGKTGIIEVQKMIDGKMVDGSLLSISLTAITGVTDV